MEESDQTLRGVINFALDTSSLLGETEVGDTKKKRMDMTLTVLTINPLTDEDDVLDQSTSDLVKKNDGKATFAEARVDKRKEDNVAIMFEEGKVLFIPKTETTHKP